MDKLKEKIFGLIVVVALGIIFIPMLFDEKNQESKTAELEATPEKPAALDGKETKSQMAKRLKEEAQAAKEAEANKEAEQARLAQAEKEADAKKEAEEQRLALAEKEAEAKKEQAEKAEQERAEKAQKDKEAAQKAQDEERAKMIQAEQVKLKAAQAQKDREQAAENTQREQASDQSTETAVTATVAQPLAAEVDSNPELAAKAKATKPAKPKAATQDEPQKAGTTRKGWVVQLGTFAESSNAQQLLKKLRSAGYPAYSRQIHRGGEPLTVVLVGPYVRREDASKLTGSLESRFDVGGVIVHYETK